MFCKDTIYKVKSQGQLFLGRIADQTPRGLKLVDVVNCTPDVVPGRYKLHKGEDLTICGTYMYHKLNEKDPFYPAYKQEITGIIHPGGMN